MFKSSNANQILFLKNKLKDIKKGKGEDIQSYFIRITKIKNDLLSIGEAIANRELTLIALGGLPPEWHVFNTTILNINKIPGFDESPTRCSQEETRMMELKMPSNRNNPTAFSAHAKRKNNAGSKKQSQGRPRFKNGRKGRCFICNKFGHYGKECPNRREHLMMMITIIPGATTTIKEMTGSTTKGKEMHPLLNLEMIELLKEQETPGMMSLML